MSYLEEIDRLIADAEQRIEQRKTLIQQSTEDEIQKDQQKYVLRWYFQIDELHTLIADLKSLKAKMPNMEAEAIKTRIVEIQLTYIHNTEY